MDEVKLREGDINEKHNVSINSLLNRYRNKYAKIDFKKAKEILEEYFSFTEFKEKQIECLNAIKNFEHVLNIMPTGGGKSLIYQVTPLLIEGISIVISPLISLIQDQIKSLRKRNIPAETINSSLNKKENENILSMLKNFNDCNIKVLYITPETATSSHFITLLEELYINEKICLISIDEVHCISTWGCDFRKCYRSLSKILNVCPFVRVYSCTATATKHVERDIILNLNLNSDGVESSNNRSSGALRIVRTSFNRPNLKYIIMYSDLLKVEKKKSVFDVISEKRNAGKIGIIYCFKRSTCDEISKYLREKGLQALSYHAGLSNNARKRIQEKWINGSAKILVATIAFGMGIDRNDVSFIIHFNLPKSIENYYQESGRSGRNGNVSFCYLYYSREDVEKLSYIIKGSYANLDMYDVKIEKKYEKEMYNLECVHNLCINEKCIRSQILNYFGEIHISNSTIINISTHGDSKVLENLPNLSKERSNDTSDGTYCCSYCSDIRGSREKIKKIISMYEQKNWNTLIENKQTKYTSITKCASGKGKKREMSDDSNSENGQEGEPQQQSGHYKLTNKRIKGFVPFQSASSIISKEIREKGIIEVMKELERREELMENKPKEQTEKMSSVHKSVPNFRSIKKKHVFSSFKVPRKL
ncbi:ATP-dependent DNA helicase Q1, putative (RECQ1) [Plasmodium ovale wallikeri]|uniref:ATP-dependent DNA helicase n=2 Tax=Plasmodium ovale TaxID=36330 RepID=A0A1A8YPY4_PLAOA|nr:ATP-dependent DNA helicase Q1, putative (RECQ1) [Plasmodium ovale wallikeri]SBT33917.1 ATP-dependent DNA helicase Q1, putative (RECQ1) [Plasmodium ovale wallikeri]SBT76379.1 ATP-dependent DNA helicase Q1, putative [Plasmodium ovale]